VFGGSVDLTKRVRYENIEAGASANVRREWPLFLNCDRPQHNLQ
jgi:hypothetical protein